jgi:hypothetical protein
MFAWAMLGTIARDATRGALIQSTARNHSPIYTWAQHRSPNANSRSRGVKKQTHQFAARKMEIIGMGVCIVWRDA